MASTPAERLLGTVQRVRRMLMDLADDLNALQKRPDLRPGTSSMDFDTTEVLDAHGELGGFETRLREIVKDARHRDTSAARLARWGVGSNDVAGSGFGGNAGASASGFGGAS
jgi:hypothetical protein